MGNKTAFGLLFGIVALVAMLAVSAASAPNEVYLVPQHSNASFCNIVEAQIWANTTDTFVAGQINLTYSHCCANVTNLEYDSLWQGTWDSCIDGREWLVFIRPLGQPTVNGTVLIGNLTIHCCNESECVTSLTFSLPSKLSDPIAGDLTVIWTDGTFTCLALTPVPTPEVTPTLTPTTPYVKLNPIAGVGIGEPLVVTGTTNREEGFSIVVTVKGPVKLNPQVVKVEDGAFNVMIDTTDAEVGTYTVKADGGDGHTDEATVEIGAAVPTPTPPPVVSPAPPVETPTSAPAPAPGFEAVFAIAGLLSVVYLLRRKG